MIPEVVFGVGLAYYFATSGLDWNDRRSLIKLGCKPRPLSHYMKRNIGIPIVATLWAFGMHYTENDLFPFPKSWSENTQLELKVEDMMGNETLDEFLIKRDGSYEFKRIDGMTPEEYFSR